MERVLNILKSPLTWLALVVVVFSLYQSVFSNDVSSVIRSDGRGYYAYLPALLIHQDGSFDQVVETERQYEKGEQIFLYQDIHGETYNKYFPGLAVLQSPFFMTACFISWVSGQPIDGYNDIFMMLFLLGSVFYFIAGLYLYSKVFEILFPALGKSIGWSLFLYTVASPLMYYAVYSPGFTHLYSFALFSAFSYIVLKLKCSSSVRLFVWLGVIIGLIFLVRPTNVLVVLIVPFLLGDYADLKEFVKNLFCQKGKRFLIAFAVFSSIAFALVLGWKWQTGHWVVWSYNGEGFNFIDPKLFESLFSYRIGLFVHTPILILSIIGLILLFKKEKYRVAMFMVYFIVNAWLISSWWCWDYESAFGNRPFTEHMVFLFLPAMFFVQRYKRAGMAVLILCTILGGLRMYQTIVGITPVARYSATSYWKSLTSVGIGEIDRWNFTESCRPFGNLIEHFQFFDHVSESNFLAGKEFGLSQSLPMKKPRTSERYYYTVRMQKKHELERFDNIYLVIDATSNNSEERSYKAVKLYNDRNEGKGEWSNELTFEGIIHDNLQQFDQVKIYIWNNSKSQFQLKNVSYEISVFKD